MLKECENLDEVVSSFIDPLDSQLGLSKTYENFIKLFCNGTEQWLENNLIQLFESVSKFVSNKKYRVLESNGYIEMDNLELFGLDYMFNDFYIDTITKLVKMVLEQEITVDSMIDLYAEVLTDSPFAYHIKTNMGIIMNCIYYSKHKRYLKFE